MKSACLAAIVLSLSAPALALDGFVGIHDPSTVVLCGGKYYTYGTGAGGWCQTTAGPGDAALRQPAPARPPT